LDNAALADALLEMAQVLEFLDENPFKAKAYERAAKSIYELATPVEELLDTGEINQVKGIGLTIAATLRTWVKDQDFSLLTDLQAQLPKGFTELMKVPGLGMKRLKTLHNILGVSTIEDLLEAVETGRLEQIKGFSDKNIEKLKDSVKALLDYRGWYLIDAARGWADAIASLLKDSGLKVYITGVCRRYMETVSLVDLLCEEKSSLHEKITSCLGSIPDMKSEFQDTMLVSTCPGRPTVRIQTVSSELVVPALFYTTGSSTHVDRMNAAGHARSIKVTRQGVFKEGNLVSVRDEEELYGLFGLQYLPPEAREGRQLEMDLALSGNRTELISAEDLRGVLHIHTNYSDGRATLKDMVRGAHERGYSWIGISDHSRSAYYAGGMSIKTLKKQFDEIDELNKGFKGITIFKGIETDILPDGSLDYPQEILRQFDFIIASVHSHMGMDKVSMTERIIKAVRNPFTTILGHPTGRLLLARGPYEVDMEAVLAEAAMIGVMVEINAHPMRLDLDWRLIPGFVAHGGRVVIAPDAHVVGGLDDMRYGLAIARKGLLTKRACVNALDTQDAREAFASRWS